MSGVWPLSKLAVRPFMVPAFAFARFGSISPLETPKSGTARSKVSLLLENFESITNVFSSAFLQFAIVHDHLESQVISQEITPKTYDFCACGLLVYVASKR
jgi:hypothetical protein